MNNGEKWFSIVARDGSAQGYFPGKTSKEACKKFGVKMEESSVKRVEWSGKEFIEAGHLEQGRLFSLS